MRRWDEFVRGQLDGGAVAARNGDRPVVARFGDLRREHAALSDGPALVDRSYRGLLEASGADRATWLHSIATNQVTTLQVGEGNYAFVLSANGRLVFDVNVLVCAEAVWLDIDRAAADAAVAHLSKHIIMEDVALTDRSDEFIRLGLTGERAKDVAVGLGAPHAANLPLLGHTTLTCDGVTITVLRSDLCGSFALELFVASDRAVDVYHALTDGRFAPAAMPVGADAVRIRRIEAGLPRYGAELHADVVPAETGRCDRAVSTNKG
ncbi:MAG: hypothetical protein ACE5E6_00550, partial [Phycisphaerae bacterium]